MKHEQRETQFTEYIDASIIAQFPPEFFQKGIDHVQKHPDEQFSVQVTPTRVYIRRYKISVNGVRPKDPINGQAIAWTPFKFESQR